MKIFLILTGEHQQLPIVKNQAVLKQVGEYSNFIPNLYAQQLIWNVLLSLNFYSEQVYNQYQGIIHSNLLEY